MPQTGHRQFKEGAGAVREATAFGGKPMFFLCVHLAECLVEAVGKEERIVAEAFIATWRPDGGPIDAAFEVLGMTVRPGKAQRGNEMRAALFRSLSVAFD